MTKTEAYSFSLNKLRTMFNEYVRTRQDIVEITKGTRAGSAFYLVIKNRMLYNAFIELLYSDDFEHEAKSAIVSALNAHSNRRDKRKAMFEYYSHLCVLRNFILYR